MDVKELYEEKLVTPVEVVKDGDWIDFGWCATTPEKIDEVLAERIEKDDLKDLKFRGGILMRRPKIFDVENAKDHLTWNSWHMGGIERKAMNEGISFYAPIRYSELPRYYRDLDEDVDVAVFVTSPMDEFGNFNFGPSSSHLAAVAEKANKIIVEVNENVPVVPGGTENVINIEDVDMIVESDNNPLPELPSAEPTEVDKRVAELIVNEIPDGAVLQLGIGGMPNAVGQLIAESDLKDLGVHTEMFVDAFVDIAKAGKITGANKNIDKGRMAFAFGAGSKKLYDFINNNPSVMATSVDYTNDIDRISALDNFVSINNAVDIDLTGQIEAESSGTKHISGAGGQLDFVLGAYKSKGGKSFICLSSTFKDREGNVKSRIVPTLAPGSVITDTRANTQYVVTEYGIVNLKGKATWERARDLISIAHPDFRKELIEEAKKLGIWKDDKEVEERLLTEEFPAMGEATTEVEILDNTDLEPEEAIEEEVEIPEEIEEVEVED